MNGINDIGRKSPSIANKIVSIGGKIKLSISNLSIKVRNSINEFIHPNRYENKIIFNTKSTFLKSKDLIISNEEVNNINNEMIESNRIDNEKNTLKERLQILKDIELPNGNLVSIDEAINDLHLCKQDSLLKSKLSLIDYITDMRFKSSEKTKVELSNKLKDNDKNMSNKVNPNINESKLPSEKESFKFHLIEITKDISLLDRLLDGDNNYGYVFLAKVVNYLEDYNKNKEQGKIDCFNKEVYLKKLASSDYFFKLNKRINNIIYLQYLKKEQSNYESGVAEKIIDTANNILNKNLSESFMDEIDEQLSIANENKNLTLQELLAKVKK
ncbi:hypothetical protein I5F10_07055 [Proteus mirabilis]|nr:hypothetical protein [Proteus mirabilis]MBG6047944.1 hypothetical protein [Proteus mirabilis]